MSVTVASLDLGIHNTVLVIEKFETKSISQPPPQTRRYNNNGEPTPEFQKYLETCIYPGRLIHFSKVCFDKGKVITAVEPSASVIRNITKWVQTVIPLLKECSVILIENQMKTNLNAKRLEHHLHSMFLFYLPENIDIIIFPSTHKTKVLGAPRNILDKDGKYKKLGKGRKDWAVGVATKVLLYRKDDLYLFSMIINHKKPDDQSDALLMILAYKVLWFGKYHIQNQRSNALDITCPLTEYLQGLGIKNFETGSIPLLILYRYMFPTYYIPERKEPMIPYNLSFNKLEKEIKDKFKIFEIPMDLSVCCEERKDGFIKLTLDTGIKENGIYYSCPHGTIISSQFELKDGVKCQCRAPTIVFE